MNIKEYLQRFLSETELEESSLQLPDVQLDPGLIQCIMISEVPPADEMEGFYSQRMDADYVNSSLALFQDADVQAQGVQDLLDMGIYITTAVKAPKHQYAVPTDEIARHVPLLEKELDLFPNLKVIMLMGDVAKKAFNMITKKRIRKNVIPSASTCKIREGAFI